MKILSVLVLIALTEVLIPSGNDATTPLSHIHTHGTPLSIMQLTTNESVTVDYDEIDKIFLHPEVKDRKIVVISIIGALRKGKSFFMDYCLRFMYAHYKSVNFPNNTLANKSDWFGPPEAPLIGFSWNAGPHRHTSGIVMWSDVFLHDNLAIVLMDTQGIFDARIFGLVTLVSSLQIFNLNEVIEENQLEYLQMATDYANFVTNSLGCSTNKPFQNLLFLMRDWSPSNSFSYGLVGGHLYLADVLRIRDSQSPELKDVRNYIMSSFENVFSFLMPHPGLEVVTDHNYDGRFSRLGDKFQHNLKQLLEWMLHSKNLKIKTVLGSEVTGHEFNGYFKSYFQKFQSPDIPKLPKIYEATIERQFANFLDTAMTFYKNGLKEFQPNYNSPNFNEVLKKVHKYYSDLVILGYDQQKKMGTVEHEKLYRAILQKDIMAFYDQWKQGMLETHKTIDQIEARNMQEKKNILYESEARFANVTGKLEAEKQELLAKTRAREQENQLCLHLKDKEKEEATKKIYDEMKQQAIKFENERQQIIADKRELLAMLQACELQIKSNIQLKEKEIEEATKEIRDEMEWQAIKFENERQQIIAYKRELLAKQQSWEQQIQLKEKEKEEAIKIIHDEAIKFENERREITAYKRELQAHEQDIQLYLQRKDKQNEEAIRKIHDEMKQQAIQFENERQQIIAYKEESLAKQKAWKQQRELEIQLDLQLKGKEEEKAIKIIHDEMKQEAIKFENERQQIIAQQKAECESILTDTENHHKRNSAVVG